MDTAQPTAGTDGATRSARSPSEIVELSVPAHPAYLGLVRTATAGVAARLDLTIDEVEDLRLAADEAGSLVLADAAPDAQLAVRFSLEPDRLVASFSAATTATSAPEESGFGWTVLAALAGSVRAEILDGALTIEIAHDRLPRG